MELAGDELDALDLPTNRSAVGRWSRPPPPLRSRRREMATPPAPPPQRPRAPGACLPVQTRGLSPILLDSAFFSFSFDLETT